MSVKERIDLYGNLMAELKARLESAHAVAHGEIRLATPIGREFCWLQIRMVCELIALSCLVAHGDAEEIQRDQAGKTYSAELIIERLSTLRPNFYPQQIQSLPEGGYKILAVNPFSKDSLLDAYARSHRHVHRGSYKNLMKAHQPIDFNPNYPEIVKVISNIQALMTLHLISLDNAQLILCALSDPSVGNRVHVALGPAD